MQSPNVIYKYVRETYSGFVPLDSPFEMYCDNCGCEIRKGSTYFQRVKFPFSVDESVLAVCVSCVTFDKGTTKCIC